MTDVASATSSVASDPGPYTTGMSENQILAREYKERQSDKADLKKSISEENSISIPQYPKMQEMPKPETTPMNGWGGAASFLATFGSMLTKRPLTNALNANADLMQAVKSQDNAKFKTAWNTAKLANENALQAANWQMDVYKSLVGKKGAEQKIILGMMKDDTGQQALNAKQFHAHEAQTARQIKVMEQQNGITYAENKVDEALKANPNLTEDEKLKIRGEGIGEWQNLVTGKYATGESKKEADEALAKFDWKTAKPTDVVPGTGLTVGAIGQYVEGAHGGAKPSQLGLGYGMNPVKKAVDNMLAEKYPGFNWAKAQLDYVGALKEEAVNAARTQPVKIAVKEIDRLAQPMITAVKDLDNTSFPNWNSVKNAYEKGTGDPKVIKAYAAVQEFKNAFGNLMTRQGASTDMVRSKADELANMNFSLDQVEALSEQAKISGAAVLNAVADAKGDIGKDVKSGKEENGKSPTASDIKHLKQYPSSKTSFDKHFGEGAADKALSGQ